jgi:hypothetical protein
MSKKDVINWPTTAIVALWEREFQNSANGEDPERDSRPAFRASDLDVETLMEVGGLDIRWDALHSNHLLLDETKKTLTLCWFPLPPSPNTSDYTKPGQLHFGEPQTREEGLWFRIIDVDQPADRPSSGILPISLMWAVKGQLPRHVWRQRSFALGVLC